MKYKFDANSLVVTRGNDKKVYTESGFFYQLKNALIKDGYDVIKKEMVKDGHMVSENVYYVRSRNMKKPGAFMAWDTAYAIRGTYEPYNDGEVTLTIEWAEVEPKKKGKVKTKKKKSARARKSSPGIGGSR